MTKKKYSIILIIMCIFLFTGCTRQLKDTDNKPVTNEETGQNLTANILCKPTDDKTVELYAKYAESNNIDLNSLQSCDSFSLRQSWKNYDGLWSTIFVKPLAWIILKIGRFVKSNGLALIIASLVIRLVAVPITKRTAMQSELIGKAQPELDRLEKKYADKTDNDSMVKKSQEMAAIYKKYNINPVMGCLFAFIQLPIFIAFLEAINRVPAIFEEKFLLFQLGTTPGVAFTKGAFVYLLLTILVGLSTYFSMKLNSSSNPNNEQVNMMNKMMFLMITFMSVFMTSALNIYWITSNLFTIAQNLFVKRRKV